MDSVMNQYFELHEKIEREVKAGRFNEVVRYSRETIPLFRGIVNETVIEYGQFDIQTSIAVETGGRIMAALGDRESLEEVHLTLQQIQALKGWAEKIVFFQHDLEIGEKILEIVKLTPGIAQLNLKEPLSLSDGRRISNITYWLERVGRLKREKVGRSYKLFPIE